MKSNHHNCSCCADTEVYLPSAFEMQECDRLTIESGISSLELMERAGKGVLENILESYGEFFKKKSRITILCGPGNNGGDGLVIARLLAKKGYSCVVVAAASSRYSDEWLYQLKKFRSVRHSPKKWGVYLFPGSVNELGLNFIDRAELIALLKNSDFVLDALLGTGQKEELRGAIREIVQVLGSCETNAKVIAIDTPTGIDTDTGAAFDPAVKADETVAIQFIKRGCVQHPASALCGDISVVPIGLKIEREPEFSLMFHPHNVSWLMREPAAHKGNFGSVLVIGGSENLPGAPVLAAESCIRSGAGLVTMTLLTDIRASVRMPEIMLFNLPGKRYHAAHIEKLAEKIAQFDVVVLGPGIGTEKETEEFLFEVLRLIRLRKKKIVIDADALNILSESRRALDLSGTIMTPHPGEAARLLGITTSEVQKNRYSAARAIYDRFGAIVVLKGADTITYFHGRGYVNSTGNPFMATAGSGDVLTGVIGALLAQGVAQFDGAALGVFLHGLAGDLAHQSKGGPIVASDITNFLSEAIRSIISTAPPS